MNVLLFHGTTEGNYLRQNTEAEVRTLAVSGGQFVYIRSHMTQQVQSDAEKVNSSLRL